MKIYNFELGPIGVNCFLIIPESGGAVMIDAPEGSFETTKKILDKNGLKVEALLLTHGHWDHIWDAKKFQDAGAKIYAHPDGASFIENTSSQSAYLYGMEGLESAKIDVKLYDGQILKFSDAEFEVRVTPGHCAGSVSYILKSQGLAFVGDLIFAGSIGRYDLPTGNFALLEKSIKEKIYTLPDSTKLLCGHGEFTSVGEEKSSNPFVRA